MAEHGAHRSSWRALQRQVGLSVLFLATIVSPGVIQAQVGCKIISGCASGCRCGDQSCIDSQCGAETGGGPEVPTGPTPEELRQRRIGADLAEAALDANDRGVECYERGDLQNALKFFREAVELAPDNEDYLQNLRRAEQRLRAQAAPPPARPAPVPIAAPAPQPAPNYREAPPIPVPRPRSGLTAAEWTQARQLQARIDQLSAKVPRLSAEEVAELKRLEPARDSLWRRVASIPGLTAAERDLLRLNFRVDASPSVYITQNALAQAGADTEGEGGSASALEKIRRLERYAGVHARTTTMARFGTLAFGPWGAIKMGLEASAEISARALELAREELDRGTKEAIDLWTPQE